MKIARIDYAIEVCRRHLDSAGAAGTEIEAYLTNYLIVITCACFEEAIEELVGLRASKSEDAALASFVRSAMGHLFRSVKTSEIAGVLGPFGAAHKLRFQEEMKKNERGETFFNNIVTNRDITAHASGSRLTFSELVEFYNEGHIVLYAVKLVLDGR